MNWISLNMTESNQVSYTINKPLDYVGFTFQPMLPQRFPALGQLVQLGFTRSPGLVSCLMSWAVTMQVSSQQKKGTSMSLRQIVQNCCLILRLGNDRWFHQWFLIFAPWSFGWTPVRVCVCFCWSWSAIPQTSAVRDSDSPLQYSVLSRQLSVPKKGLQLFSNVSGARWRLQRLRWSRSRTQSSPNMSAKSIISTRLEK